MSEPVRLTDAERALDEVTFLDVAQLGEGDGTRDLGTERAGLYVTLAVILLAGSFVTRGNVAYLSGPMAHSILEALATVFAFIVGALALVRYYSRKEATFLLIGCGFLGAGALDLNHAVATVPALLDVRVLDPRIDAEAMYLWTWTAGRVFLSLFLYTAFYVWRQEKRSEDDESAPEEETLPELSVYGMALVLTLTNILFFDYFPLRSYAVPSAILTRPFEFIPALAFGLTFLGFYRRGTWRSNDFEHWMLISLLIAAAAHGLYMASSAERFDAAFDVAHLLKLTSYGALLTGLLSSVYATFTREALMLEALTSSNEALEREVEVRAETERGALESEERLQSFLDNANDLIQSVDVHGRFLYVNSAWKAVLGYSDEDLDRLHLLDIVHPHHREAFEAELERVLEGSRPRRFNVEYLAADGRLVILSGSAQAQFVTGRAASTQSILRDVTEQRLAERRLDESQQNLEALVENTGDSIWSVDLDHRLITLNSAFSLAMEARTGREPRAGLLPSDVFPAEEVQWYTDLYERTLRGERSVAVRADRLGDHVRYFELYANPIQSLEGVSGAVFFGKDVTPRVHAEEALREAKDEAEAANRAKSDFLANMSHELRTPLNSIIGFTNVLRKNKDERLNDKDLGFLERVLSNGKHLLSLINEVLDLAKVEAGRMELIIEDVDLVALCVETTQQLEGQARSNDRDVVVQVEVPETAAKVETDSARLKQVIINLVGNALKFTHEGSVTVRLDMAKDGRTPLAISVVDTGIGIPEDRLEAIFEAFQQAEDGTSRKYGGTGLGLALSRSICLLLGFDLVVESRIGEGSVFSIVLDERFRRPTHEAGDSAEGEEDVDEESAAGDLDLGDPEAVELSGLAAAGAASKDQFADLRVLVIDDEKDARLLLSHVLKGIGCQVLTASNGAEGLAVAREHLPNLITTDLVMPEMTGWEVIRRLKADAGLRHIPVVVVSYLAQGGRSRLLGAVDAVSKPFQRQDLLRVLWRNLGRQHGGHVLVVVEDRDRAVELREVVTARGLDVTTVAGEDLPTTLSAQGVDAIVLDLACKGTHGVATLLEIREDPLYTGLPILAITHERFTEKERGVIDDLATLHVPMPSAAEALGRMLDLSFATSAEQG